MSTTAQQAQEQIAALWSLGDYPRIAADELGAMGARLVAVCDVRAGQRVLDVGAGPGTATIPAARTGASVVALDPTPALLDACRAAAERSDVVVETVEGVVEDLPFPDDDFDVVLSSVAAIFAPDHQRAADEMLRVCRPGGTVGLATWLPHGTVGAMFRALAPHLPAPPGDSPLRWGEVDHVRGLLGDRVADLRTEEGAVPITHSRTSAELTGYYRRYFGPVIAAYQGHAHDPEATAALDRDLLQWADDTARDDDGGPRWELEYLLVRATAR